ncbi:hypothetical protein A3750_04795 [Oleiphilus sp. HI0079]|uniref:hypothetical protein n=1 Tax=Oleiphilus sp. HI0079 TaxID=1822254 RepID=UPI0007C2D2A6|nr:hypothetical protein [Oleiphilus sp. HI0079]KZZ12843.1 hypothetical protein A3750_04795 [Oleiphilus sp. HI0079]
MNTEVEQSTPSRLKAFCLVAIATYVIVTALQMAIFGGGNFAALLGKATAPLILGLPALAYKRNPLVSYGCTVLVLTLLMIFGSVS